MLFSTSPKNRKVVRIDKATRKITDVERGLTKEEAEELVIKKSREDPEGTFVITK